MKWLATQAERLREHGFTARLKAFAKKVARPVIKRCDAFLSTRPALRLRLVMLAKKLRVYAILKRIYRRLSTQFTINTSAPPIREVLPEQFEASYLTPRARRIYNDLRSRISGT